MRFAFALPILCSVFALASLSPWEGFLQRHQGLDPRNARWTLCVRPGDFSAGVDLADEPLQKLVLGGDLSVEMLGVAEARDFWSQRSWGAAAHWVLLSPEGELASTGSGLPKGEAVLDAIHAASALPRWEARAAFLKENPEQGEANQESVDLAFRLLRARLMFMDRQGKLQVPAWHPDPALPQTFNIGRAGLPPGSEGEALADELFGGVAKVLPPLFAVPGWQWAMPRVAAQLSQWDLSQSSRIRGVFAQAASAAEDLFRRDPYDYDLANFWVESREAAGQAPASLGGQFTPIPGKIWPTPAILNRLLEPYRRRADWEGALQCLTELTPSSPPEPLSASGWEEYCKLHCAILVQKGIALASQGSWDLAVAAMEDAQHWGGGQGVRESLLMRGGQWSGPASDQAHWRGLLNQALARNGARPPMPALPQPLRLVLMGSPKWVLDWFNLPKAPELAPWSPGELRWEAISAAAFDRLRHQQHWPPGPRWALFRGEELRVTGAVCPEPKALATTLEGEGPALLQRFQRTLEGQRDSIAAHRARFALLLPRMPDIRLEALLAQDAAAARLPLPFGPDAPWKPNPDVWGACAQEVLPKVEAELRSWPSRSPLWTTWVSWARFHPAQPSITRLAQGLPYWSPRGDWRAGLPYLAQRAVAAELRRQGRFDEMRSWFRAAWEALDQRPVAALRLGERQWVLERRKEEETAIFQPLRDALRALGCIQEQTELERVFAGMMGREGARRP